MERNQRIISPISRSMWVTVSTLLFSYIFFPFTWRRKLQPWGEIKKIYAVHKLQTSSHWHTSIFFLLFTLRSFSFLSHIEVTVLEMFFHSTPFDTRFQMDSMMWWRLFSFYSAIYSDFNIIGTIGVPNIQHWVKGTVVKI